MSVDRSDEPSSSSKRCKSLDVITMDVNSSSMVQSSSVKDENELGYNDPIPPAFVDQYHVVKHIMEYMSLRDVLKASQVNRQWSEIGRIVRKKRKNFHFVMLYHPYTPHHKLAFEYFNNSDVSEEATELVQSGKNGMHPHKPKKKFPCFVESVKSSLQNEFLNAYDEAQMLITFGTSSLDRQIQGEYGRRKLTKENESIKLILGGIAEKIPCLASFSCGLIAATANNEGGYMKSLEIEKGNFPCISGIAIPKVPGLQVRMFTVTKQHNRILKGKIDADQFRELVNISPEEEPNLKGIVLFHKPISQDSPVIQVIRKYLKSNPKVALAGGMHENVLVSDSTDDPVIAGGMLIFGEEESVRVSSVALEEPGLSDGNREKIKKLKESLIVGGKSFALMFACNGRGRYMHGSPNAESDYFNSLLPSTPMLGAFTLGEFCYEVIQPLSEDSSVNSPEMIEFAYTTVFLVVSYKHPVDNEDKPK